MIAAERQRARLERILDRQRGRAVPRVRLGGALPYGKVVAPEVIRNALARLACELDPLSIDDILSSPDAERFSRTSKALRVRPSTLGRVVRGVPVGRAALARVRRALVREGVISGASS